MASAAGATGPCGMNCGNRLAKNTASLALPSALNSPCENAVARPSDAVGPGADLATGAPREHAWISDQRPSPTRVAAPASRITVKAGPQAASSAVRPAPTARVQAACPLATPRAENTPPRRPA